MGSNRAEGYGNRTRQAEKSSAASCAGIRVLKTWLRYFAQTVANNQDVMH
jgi:hypothetical protein